MVENFSTKNTYSTSTGERLTRSQIESRIRTAKAQKIDHFTFEHGYVFCEECGINASNARIDCSHTISVKECLETGRAELSYDIDNVRLLCRECHSLHDKLY